MTHGVFSPGISLKKNSPVLTLSQAETLLKKAGRKLDLLADLRDEVAGRCQARSQGLNKALMAVGRLRALELPRGANPFGEWRICPPLDLVDLPIGERWMQLEAAERIVRNLVLLPCSPELSEARHRLQVEAEALRGLDSELRAAQDQVERASHTLAAADYELSLAKRWSNLHLLQAAVAGGWATTAGTALLPVIGALLAAPEWPIGGVGHPVALAAGAARHLLPFALAGVSAVLTVVWVRARNRA